MQKILFVLLALVAVSCKKEEVGPELPAATQEGKNVLAFKLNGIVVNISGKPTGFSGAGVEFNYGQLNINERVFVVFAQSPDPERYDFRIGIKWGDTLGVYQFENYWPYYGTLYDFTDGSTEPQGRTYQTDSAHTGSVTLTKYTGSVLSGTFYFDAINTGNGKVVHITDGRFDISN